MTIIITRKANADIKRIYSYISNVIGMKGTALNIVTEIQAAIEDLVYFPERYKFWENSGLRYFAVRNYTVFYHFDEAAEEIRVERVIYSRRDIEALL